MPCPQLFCSVMLNKIKSVLELHAQNSHRNDGDCDSVLMIDLWRFAGEYHYSRRLAELAAVFQHHTIQS